MTDRLAAAIEELVAAIRDQITPTDDAPEYLMSIDDAAIRLGVGRTTVYAEVQAGRLRSLKVGRRRLIPASAVADYIGSR